MKGQRGRPGQGAAGRSPGAHTGDRRTSLQTDLPPTELGLTERDRERE